MLILPPTGEDDALVKALERTQNTLYAVVKFTIPAW